MKTRIVAIIVVVMVIFALMFPVSVHAQEPDQSKTARTVYIYPWDQFKVELDTEHMLMFVKSDWQSVFGIDDIVRIYSTPSWYKLGKRTFFIQDTPGFMTSKEAVFIGEVDGIPQVIKIGFSGELIEVNSRGIVYERDGMTYYKSFYPILEKSRWVYPEKQGWNVTAPAELYDSGYEVAVPAEAPF